MDIKAIIRNINLLNILLVGFIIVLLLYVFYPMFTHSIPFVLPSSPQKTSEISDPIDDKLTLSPADYFIIGDENLFHPEREVPVEKQKKDAKELPKPEFFLYGTLITDDVQIAYVEDIKDPVSTPGRGKRQTAVRVGDSMGGYSVKEIHADRVLMTRGEDTIILLVLDSNKPNSRGSQISKEQSQKDKATDEPTIRQTRNTRPKVRSSTRNPRVRVPANKQSAVPVPTYKTKTIPEPKTPMDWVAREYFDKRSQ